jgi:hypothetical protein
VKHFAKFAAIAFAGAFSLPAGAVPSLPDFDVNGEIATYQAVFGENAAKRGEHDNDHQGDHADRPDRGDHMDRVKKACAAVEATDEQKTQIMDAAFEYKDAAIGFKADMERAKLAFVRAALATDDQAAAATDSAAAGVTAATGLLTAKADLVTSILFEILTQPQRKAGLVCLHAMAQAHSMHGRGHGHGHGHGH